LIARSQLRDTSTGRWPTDRDLGRATTFFDIVSERDVSVTAELGDTEIALFDRDHKCMARWKYADMVHAFDPIQRLDYVFITRDNPDAQLTVGDADLMRRLIERAPQLRRKRALSARLEQVTVWTILCFSFGLVGIGAVVWIYQSAPHWLQH